MADRAWLRNPLLVLVGAALLWLATRGTPRPERPAEQGERVASEEVARPADDTTVETAERPRGGGRFITGVALAAGDDAPIAGASVSVDHLGRNNAIAESGPAVETGSDGAFSVDGWPEKSVVVVRAEGFTTARQPVPDDLENVTIRLDAAAAVRGRVLSAADGKPVAGAVVRTSYDVETATSHLSRYTRTVTDADGRFSRTGLPANTVSVFVLGGGWASVNLASIRGSGSSPHVFDLTPGRSTDLTLLVERTATVRGRVRDDAGEPVAATVEIERPMDPLIEDAEMECAGEFEIGDLVPGFPSKVWIRSEAFAPHEFGPLTLRPGETREIEIRMPPRGWVRVRVIEADTGEPVPGARVEICDTRWSDPKDEFRTNADGRARIGPFARRSCELWVDSTEYVESDATVQVNTDVEQEIVFRLRKGLAISGRVIVPDGLNLKLAGVEAGDEKSTFDVKTGAFRIPGLPPGRHRVRAVAFGEDLPWFEGAAEAEAGTTGIEIPLGTSEWTSTPSDDTPVTIRVLDPSGRPVPRAAVRITGAEDEGGEYGWWSEILIGCYETRLPEDARDLSIEVYDAWSASDLPLPVAPACIGPLDVTVGEVVIRLEPEGAVAGIVRDEDGNGLAGVLVKAFHPETGQTHRTARTDPAGRFRIGGLMRARYDLRVEAPAGFRAPEDPVPAKIGATDVTIALVRAGQLRFVIVDHEDRPVMGAKVEVRPATGPDRWSEHEGVSDEAGVVRVEGFPDATRFGLTMEPPDGRHDLLRTHRWKIESGDRVAMKRALRVTAVVHDRGGYDVEDLVLWARKDGSSWVEGAFAGDDTFSCGPFPAEPIELVLLPRGADPDHLGCRGVVVPAGTEGVPLKLELTRTLTVRVPGWPGAEDVRGMLSLEGGEYEFRSEEPDASGTFRFENVTSGPPIIFWVGPLPDGRHAYRTDIGPRETDIEAPLVAGGTVTGRLIFPSTATTPSISACGPGFMIRGDVQDDGSFVIRGIPPGKVRLEVGGCCTYEGRHAHPEGSVETTTGAEGVEVRAIFRNVD